jgi:hypothetical protein
MFFQQFGKQLCHFWSVHRLLVPPSFLVFCFYGPHCLSVWKLL